MKRGGAHILSVVVPVYNRRKLIAGAIDSVLSQELPPGWELELVAVDDGSDDGTLEFLRGRSDGEPRMRVLRLSRSGYPGAVRNRGVESASGEVIAFLDSDDRWLPGKVALQLPLHIESPCALTHTRERWERDGRVISQRGQRHQRRGDLYADALWKCIIGPSTVMVDRDFFLHHGGFREDLEVAEDYELWLRLLCHTHVDYVEREGTLKRAGAWPQLSEKYGQIEGFRIAALRRLVDDRYVLRFRSPEDHATARSVLSRKMRIYAAGARKRGRIAEAEALEGDAKLYEF